MNRRDFLKSMGAVGSIVICSSMLEACTQKSTPLPEPTSSLSPEPTRTMQEEYEAIPSPHPGMKSTPLATKEGRVTQVAFVKTHERSAGIHQAIDLLEADSVRGKSLLLKPNFNSADPSPGSTHNDTLSTLIQKLQGMGAGRITIGDRSGMGDTRQVMISKDIFRMADELGCEILVFNELGADGWEMMQFEGSHWQRGFAVARPVLEADGVVQACCLKTHRYGGHFTMSLKNSVGLVAQYVPGVGYDFMRELHDSPDQRRMIAEINFAYQPDLIVLDGVEAFVTGGPDTGKRVEPHVILASKDRVAIDAVGVAILRYFGTTAVVGQGPIFQQEQIARAVELGLGVDGPGNIELVTGDPESEIYAAQIHEILISG